MQYLIHLFIVLRSDPDPIHNNDKSNNTNDIETIVIRYLVSTIIQSVFKFIDNNAGLVGYTIEHVANPNIVV